MASDILEQLAESEVPPIPVDALERGFNDRLNNRLFVQHLLDFALRGLPCVALHTLRGFIAVLLYTISGKFIVAEQKDKDSEEES